jgi:hypothetical protein
MNKEFIPYEESSELKELGFDEPCFAFYDAYNGDSHLFYNLRGKPHWLLRVINILRNKQEQSVLETSQYHLEYLEGDNAVLAPLYQQAFRWFREKYGLYMELFVDDDKQFGFMITRFTENDRVDLPMFWSYKTYEEAELACLCKLIEIVKNS